MNLPHASGAIPCDDSIIEEAKKTSSLIAASRQHLAESKSVDLGALEVRVRNLCNNIRSAPNKSCEDVKSIICSIMEDLNQLELEVVAHRQEVISRQNKISQRGATLAYGGGMAKA